MQEGLPRTSRQKLSEKKCERNLTLFFIFSIMFFVLGSLLCFIGAPMVLGTPLGAALP